MNNSRKTRLVAIIDDDRSVQCALKDLLESAGLFARCFGSAEEFLRWDQRHDTACLVLDIHMPGMSGFELQTKLEAEQSQIPVIFVTAAADARMKTRARQAGAVDVLSKPFDDEALLDRVTTALKI